MKTVPSLALGPEAAARLHKISANFAKFSRLQGSLLPCPTRIKPLAAIFYTHEFVVYS
jgi:hypothetical protein